MSQQRQIINQFIKNCKEYIDTPREINTTANHGYLDQREADPEVRRRRPVT
jgi:hypothetical protein